MKQRISAHKNSQWYRIAIRLTFIAAGMIAVGFVIVLITNLTSNPYRNAPELTLPQGPTSTVETPKILDHNFEKYLIAEAALLGATDNMSYFFKDTTTGQTSSLEPSRSWIPASMIKAFVAIEAFRQRRLGVIDFNQMVTIKAENVVPTELESDELPRLREGTEVTIKQLVEAMIIQSDNTAYNTLLDILDRRTINSSLADLGITETVVGEKLNLDDSQFAKDLTVPGRQPNTTTAKDFATLFDLLYGHKIQGAEEILAIFKRQKINTMIPALLPQDTPVAHKTGDWAPIYHDGGIVYKPNDPFILSIFTNSGKPEVLANMARVAYYRNADSVGVFQPKKPSAQTNYPPIYLAEAAYSKVLGEATSSVHSDKFPTITAADLGITQQDLTIDNGDLINIRPAVITPNSIFYGLKRSLENIQYRLAFTPDQRADILLSQSASRLSEARALFGKNQVDKAKGLLDESQTALSQGTTVTEKSASKKDFLLIKAKQISDFQFASLASSSNQVSPAQKEKFVDIVYNLYQKQQATVLPIVKGANIANPSAQKPAVATVEKVVGNTLTVKFDNGQTKEVLASDFTPVRQFHQQALESPSSIEAGQKIAIIGQTNREGQIIPQFILSKLPQQFPARITGTVLEIRPKDSSLIILDQLGNKQNILVQQDTIIRGKDTSVALAGIRAGSQITVFTTDIQPTTTSPSPTATFVTSTSAGKLGQPVPTSAPAPTPIPVSNSRTTSPANSPTNSKTASPTNPPTKAVQATPKSIAPTGSPVPMTTITATTITVTKNSSGSEEKGAPPKPSSKPSSAPSSSKK